MAGERVEEAGLRNESLEEQASLPTRASDADDRDKREWPEWVTELARLSGATVVRRRQ